MADAMTKSLLGAVTGLQAAALVGTNLRALKKKKKKSPFALGVTNLVGIGLVGATAQAASSV